MNGSPSKVYMDFQEVVTSVVILRDKYKEIIEHVFWVITLLEWYEYPNRDI